jgi:hypothetical protein
MTRTGHPTPRRNARASLHRDLLDFAHQVARCHTTAERAQVPSIVILPDLDLIIAAARRLVEKTTPIDAAAIVRKDRRS